MAYRRRQQVPSSSSSTSSPSFRFEEEEEEKSRYPLPPPQSDDSLAAKAIRASSAHRDSSLSSAYAARGAQPAVNSSSPSRFSNPPTTTTTASSSPSQPHQYTSIKNLNESKHGFWGVLARKAKAILDDDEDNAAENYDSPGRTRVDMPSTPTRGKQHRDPNQHVESRGRTDNPTLQKGLGAFTSSLSYISGTIGTALEEGRTIVENRTADIIQETRKHIKKKASGSAQNQAQKPQTQADLELQLKASRDVAMAMAAKAKLLLRELKTVKADFAFAKERCAQLEEENKILRENRERGDSPEDDDLIRLQLETLLAEKARLAHENSVYARENRFLREVVEYHQLTMQDVVYLDEGTEEVTEVYPIKVIPSYSSPASEVQGVSQNSSQ
ncbi:uncharacterized protein Pyn_15752 [Prunus yedoensis var. nudiflora]|uniref:Uncharacterized protein n=1 Tax=Prunus yedoensis var. nudiflora TaxID=2094558 RepID=A0A314YKZ3_PRUYE|nr:uncharacterized protein Pyn_15752 [Prunus yedoensis var. nudiflora]